MNAFTIRVWVSQECGGWRTSSEGTRVRETDQTVGATFRRRIVGPLMRSSSTSEASNNALLLQYYRSWVLEDQRALHRHSYGGSPTCANLTCRRRKPSRASCASNPFDVERRASAPERTRILKRGWPFTKGPTRRACERRIGWREAPFGQPAIHLPPNEPIIWRTAQTDRNSTEWPLDVLLHWSSIPDTIDQ